MELNLPSEVLGLGAFSVGTLFLITLKEPTIFGAFCIGCLLTPLIVSGEPQSQQLLPRPFDAEMWVAHFADYAMVAGAALMLGAVVACQGAKQKLSRRDVSGKERSSARHKPPCLLPSADSHCFGAHSGELVPLEWRGYSRDDGRLDWRLQQAAIAGGKLPHAGPTC